jgi:hypothetical protein
MLAAALNKPAPATIFDAREKKRHPITEPVSRLAMAKSLQLAR